MASGVVWAWPYRRPPPPPPPAHLLCSPLCRIQPCCTPEPSAGTPGSLLFGPALCCSAARSFSLPALFMAVAFPPSHLTACFRHWGGLCSRGIFQVLAYTPLPGESFPTTLWAGASLSSRCTRLLCQAGCSMGLFSCCSLDAQSRAGPMPCSEGTRGALLAGWPGGRANSHSLPWRYSPCARHCPECSVSGVAFHPDITPWSLLHVSASCGTGTLNHLPNVASSRGRVKIHARPVCALGYPAHWGADAGEVQLLRAPVASLQQS